MSKTELRKEFLSKRKSFFNMSVSAEICRKAIMLPEFMNAETVMLYLPSNYEVDTSLLIAQAKRLGKKVCAPRVLSETEMEAGLMDDTGLKKGAFNIWEPQGEKITSFDIVFVPGVAFDKRCYRLGYGKGYYDRFLTRHNAFTVGLGFSCQIADIIPSERHDIQLDMILTENEVYR